MPKKLTMSGNVAPERKSAKAAPKAEKAPSKAAKPAAQEYKPRFGPGSAGSAAKPTLPKGGQAIVIGKGGKVQSGAPKAAKPAPKPAGKPAKQPLAKPVQRVNRHRGQNGKRG